MTLQRDLPKPARRRPRLPERAVLAIVLAVAGLLATFVAFFFGIDAALTGSGSGPGLFVVLLVGGLLASTAALVLALIGVIGGKRRVLSTAALLIALVPGAGILALVLATRG